LGDSIIEYFDKENASEKDLDKTRDDALIAPLDTKNLSAAAATGDLFKKTGSAIGLGPLPVNSGALPD
jgi:hypothetical protein